MFKIILFFTIVISQFLPCVWAETTNSNESSTQKKIWLEVHAIGSLRQVQGTVNITRKLTTVVAKEGLLIFQDDLIKTGKNGSVGIIFNDNTRMSLGVNSELTVSKYIFDPAKKEYGMLTQIFKGTVSYLSGKLSKLAPDSVSITTPSATIGTRGTQFLIQVGD